MFPNNKKMVLKGNLFEDDHSHNRIRISINHEELLENFNSNMNFLDQQPSMQEREIGNIFCEKDIIEEENKKDKFSMKNETMIEIPIKSKSCRIKFEVFMDFTNSNYAHKEIPLNFKRAKSAKKSTKRSKHKNFPMHIKYNLSEGS